MASTSSSKSECGQPLFAHHPGNVSHLLRSLQKGYHRNEIAKETLVGSQTTGYTSDTVPIEEIYGRLRLIPGPELHQNACDFARQGSSSDEAERMAHVFAARAEHARCVAMEDILKAEVRCGSADADRESARVLVLGGAGSGKTMSFSRKAAVDWSNGRLWPEIELLFALPLRQSNISTAKDVKELLRLEYFGFSSNAMKEKILEYLDENWDRVCIILDGLDEVELDKCSNFVQSIIEGVALTEAHIVVTSRPSDEALTLDLKHPFSTRLELMGFGKDEVAEYVRKVLKEEDAANFIKQVNNCPQLAAFLQSPLNCVNACLLYRSGTQKLPTTLPAMTTTVMDAVVRHAARKRRNPDNVSIDWKKVDAELKATVNEVASFAFSTLVKKITLFKKQHFKEFCLSDAARDVGLLVNYDDLVFDTTPQWRFAHLTMQEALAARYVSVPLLAEEEDACLSATTSDYETTHDCGGTAQTRKLRAGDVCLPAGWEERITFTGDALYVNLITRKVQQEHPGLQMHAPNMSITWLVDELGALTGSLNTFWRCLAAELNETSVNSLICAILTTPSPLYNSSSKTTPAWGSTSSSNSATATTTMESEQHHDAAASQNSHRPKLSEVLNPSHEQLRQLADDLSPHLTSEMVDRLATLLLSAVVKGDAAGAVHSVMPPSRDITTLAFLQQLLLRWKTLSPKASLLVLHRAVAEIHQTAASTCFPFLSSEIASLPQSRPMADLHSAEGKRRLLLAIRCYHEFSSSTTNKPILPSLKNALEKSGLDLKNVFLTTSDSAAIGLVLEVFNSVITLLDITNCLIGDAGFQQLSDGLSTCTGLQRLCMSGSMLSDKHTACISKVIQKNRATLLELITHTNFFSSEGNAVLHQHTHRCKRLLSVGVGGPKVVTCGVNKRVISSIMRNCNNLNTLLPNQFTMTADTHALLLLTLAANIVILGLQRIGMSVQSTAALNTFLQQQQHHLLALDLSGNNLSDDFVYGVHTALACCSRLASIQLVDCRLTSASLPCLARLFRQLPSLLDVRLSNNDFRQEHDGAEDFAKAVDEHQTMQVLEMPGPSLLSSPLLRELLFVRQVQYANVVTWDEMIELQDKKVQDGSTDFATSVTMPFEYLLL